MNPLSPPLLKKKEDLYTILRSRIDQFALDVEGSGRDTHELIDQLEDEILELLDEALCPDTRNTVTFGVGEEGALTVPYFEN